ncbi:MAG: hypothetical protein ACRDTS_11275, partial [Mycobacterium sp.]
MNRRLLLLFLAVLALPSLAQLAPSRWSSLQKFPHGYVDRSNLDVHLSFPIYSRNPGSRAQLAGQLVYDGNLWVNNGAAWALNPVAGWHFEANAGGTITSKMTFRRCMYGKLIGQIITATYTFTAPDGTSAGVGSYETGTICPSQPPSSETVIVQASRDSYTVHTDSSGDLTAFDSEGDSVLNRFVDPTGNAVSAATASGTTTFTDPLGTALTVSGTNPITYSYAGPSGTTAAITETMETIPVSAAFGCYTVSSGSLTVPSELSYPGGKNYYFYYDSSGRLDQMHLPTGGSIYFSTQESCASGVITTTLSRWLSTFSPSRAWSWTFNGTSTVETTPDGNQSVYAFPSPGVLGDVSYYHGTQNPSNLISTISFSYGPSSGNITQEAATTELYPAQLYSVYSASFDPYGRVVSSSTTDWGASSSGGAVLRSKAANWTVAGANSEDEQTSASITGPKGLESQTSWTYTPAGQIATEVRGSGSASLTTTYTYNSNGTISSIAAPSGTTSYAYSDGCSNGSEFFPTTIQSPIAAVKTTLSWDCAGGVLLSSTDGNGQTTTYAYADPNHIWRPTSITRPGNLVTTISYLSPTISESSTPFNSSSTNDVRTTLGSLGRPVLVQRETGPNSGTYDSVQIEYDPMGRTWQVSQPYQAGAGVLQGTNWTTTTYDEFSRPLTITDPGGNETVHQYTDNDELITVHAYPNGGKQEQFDALGRLTSVCELTTGAQSGACGQTVAQTGYLTTYTRDARADLTAVAQNTQPNHSSSQSRSYIFDELGRLTQAVNPETGTTNYYYGAAAPGCPAQAGTLAERLDAAGNVTCYQHDALGRVTGISYPSGPNASATPSKTFVYGDINVDGVAMQNAIGRLAEAYTGSSTAKIVDEGFSYNALGQPTDTWETTPGSGGWYHVSEAVAADGAPTSMTIPDVPAMTFALDGEGRMQSASAVNGNQNPLSSISYAASGSPTALGLGNGDSEAFTYDPGTGQMKQYTFTVGQGANAKTDVGQLWWNPDGTLSELSIADAVPNTADSEICNFTQDQLGRLASASCSNGSTNLWGQNFSLDPFGNLSKSVPSGATGIAFQPAYNVNNQFGELPGSPVSYNADGELLQDEAHT